MKSVGSDDQIELSDGSAPERDTDLSIGLIDTLHTLAKYRFNLAFDLAEDGCGKVRPRKTHIAAMHHLG